MEISERTISALGKTVTGGKTIDTHGGWTNWIVDFLQWFIEGAKAVFGLK